MIMVGICARTGHRPPTGDIEATGVAPKYPPLVPPPNELKTPLEVNTCVVPAITTKAIGYSRNLSRRMHGNGEALPFQGYTVFGGRRGMEEEA